MHGVPTQRLEAEMASCEKMAKEVEPWFAFL